MSTAMGRITIEGTQAHAVYALLGRTKSGVTAGWVYEFLRNIGVRTLAPHTILSHVRAQLGPDEVLRSEYRKLPGRPRALKHYWIERRDAS